MLVDRIHARRSSVIDPSSPPNAGLLTAALGALTPDWLAYTGRAGFVERQFSHEFAAALAGQLPAGQAVGVERQADLADWPNVGHFDVVVDVHRGVQIRHAFELKWCKRKDKLNEALWDAAKLALAVAVGRTEHGSLLYAGPVGLAASSGVGALLFTGGHFELAELIHRYPAWWDWPVKTRPTRLPQTVSTIPAGAVAWRMRTGAAWEARLLNVLPGSGWTPVRDGWPTPPLPTKS